MWQSNIEMDLKETGCEVGLTGLGSVPLPVFFLFSTLVLSSVSSFISMLVSSGLQLRYL